MIRMNEGRINRPTRQTSEDISLHTIDAINAGELSKAEEQIETIKNSLQDLARRVQAEKPDTLVFLDMSARILGTPYLRYLTETMGKDAPNIRFYNDDELKGAYLSGQEIDEVADRDLSDLKDKKVFLTRHIQVEKVLLQFEKLQRN